MALPRPTFIDTTAETVESEAILFFEETANRKLYPAQPERLLVNLIAYREAVVRAAIQYAAEQNLVNYATGTNLDHLGALLAVERLPADFAQTTLEFTKDADATAISVLVPSGTRVATSDGAFFFATDADLTIAGGLATGTVTASCQTAGSAGNGYTAGQIDRIVDPVNNILSVANTTTSTGGDDIESDNRLRDRIKLAPNQFSVAGPTDAYKFFVLSVDPSIIDASFTTDLGLPTVDVFILTADGLPSVELIAAVQTALDSDQVRPLTDEVTVQAPTEVNFDITANIVLYAGQDGATFQTQLEEAAAAYMATLRVELGRDIVRSQIIAALSLDGVYSVTLAAPVSDSVLTEQQWANGETVTINITGTVEG